MGEITVILGRQPLTVMQMLFYVHYLILFILIRKNSYKGNTVISTVNMKA